MAVQPYSATAPIKALSGSQTAPGITFTGGDTDTGIYSPASNQVGITTGGTSKLIIDENGSLQVVRGTKDLPAIYFDNGTGVYSPGADQVAISTNSSQRLLIDASGNVNIDSNTLYVDATNNRVGLGTSVPQAQLQVLDTIKISNSTQAQGNLILGDGGSTAFNVGIARWNGGTNAAGAGGIGYFAQGSSNIGGHFFYTGDAAAGSQTERMRISATGAVGIGTTPVVDLDVAPAASTATFRIHARSNTTPVASIELVRGTNTTFGADASGDYRIKNDTGNLSFEYGDSGVTTERARIDSAGRLLVGTSNAIGTYQLQTANTNGGSIETYTFNSSSATTAPFFILGKSRNATIGQHTVVQNEDTLGTILFAGSDGTNFEEAARITCQVDGEPATAGDTTDMPGRLVFSTTADGASSPTERMRIGSSGTTTLSNPNSSRTAPHILLVDTGDNRTASIWNNTGIMSLGGSGTSNTTSININHGDTYIEYTGAQYFSGVGTTASAANAFLNSGSSPANQLLRSTSSLRYKTDIEDLEQDRSDSILNFRPVWYRSTAEADRSDWSWYGLIAEEVAEIEPRLVHWTYLEDAYEEVEGKRQLKPDAEMVPDGVQYDRLTVLLLDVVQRQHKAIGILEAKVAALESA